MVRLEGFRHQDEYIVHVSGPDRRRITLLVIPPAATTIAAHDAMAAASGRDNVDQPADLLVAAGVVVGVRQPRLRLVHPDAASSARRTATYRFAISWPATISSASPSNIHVVGIHHDRCHPHSDRRRRPHPARLWCSSRPAVREGCRPTVRPCCPGLRQPGLRLLIPFADRMRKVSMQTVVMGIPAQGAITRDNVTLTVDAVVYYRVIDPVGP